MNDAENRPGSLPRIPAGPAASAALRSRRRSPALPDPPVIVPPVPAPTFASALGSWLGRLQRRYRHLLFKPKTFFAGMTAPKDRNELIFLAFGLGLGERHRQTATPPFSRTAEAVNGHSWPLYWLGRIGFAAFYAGAALWIGAAWYRFRLRLAGIKADDIWLVRRVYLSAAMVYAVPHHPQVPDHDLHPRHAPVGRGGGPRLADPGLRLLPLWSTIVGYVGVRTVYKPRGPGAPILVLRSCPGPSTYLRPGDVRGHRAGAKRSWPDYGLRHRPSGGRSPARRMAFSYPANWSVMKGEKNYDPAGTWR
ncbi:MAG: hypothetical protein MZU84_09330 [Sphingobacterium sp.]|nr:hypothetical protein [Sphingobacterium sp.]